MKILKKIKKYYQKKIVLWKLKQCKIIHIMFNDKFNAKYVDFLNNNFLQKDHFIVCKEWFSEFPFPKGKNVLKIQTLSQIKINLLIGKKIICHSLFDPELVDLLYNNPILLENAYWCIWGGDLYGAPRDEKNDFIRSHFKGYLTGPDKEETQKRYHTNDNFFFTFYSFPVDRNLLAHVEIPKKDFIQIQINNSCDKSTITQLEVLSKFKHENIKIVTIVSYGDLQYKDEIITKGKEIFGNKFSAIEEFFPPKKYCEHLACNDILILAQNRQQGGGNIYASFFLGKKVFINSDVSTYSFLMNQEHFVVYDTYSIPNLSFHDFIKNDTVKNNRERSKKLFDEENMKYSWEIVFND